MASQNPRSSIDVQNLLTGAAKLELKLIQSGVEAMQVYMNQASRFSRLAGDTLQAVQDDKASLADTARQLSDFGRQSMKVYVELAQKMGTAYYDELDRLAGSAQKSVSSTQTVAVRPKVRAAPAGGSRPKGRAKVSAAPK